MELNSWMALLILSPLLDAMFQTDTDTGKVACHGEDSFVQKGRCFTFHSEKLTFYEAVRRCKEKDSKIVAYANVFITNGSFYKGEEGLYWSSRYSDERTFSNSRRVSQDPCFVTSPTLTRSYVSCFSKYPFACESLYSNVFSMKVNEETVFIDRYLIITDGSLKIECITKAVNDAVSVYVTKNNNVIARADNQSQVVYHVPVMTCEDAGAYKCKAEFQESGIILWSLFAVTMSCPLSLTLSVNGKAINNTNHVIFPIGTAINLKCSVKNADETYELSLSKKSEELSESRSIKEVTHNFTIKDCKDTGTFTCFYYSTNRRIGAYIELNLVVDNCNIHIISFNFEIAYERDIPYTYLGCFLLKQRNIPRYQYKYLVCNAETYSRPSNLAIRAHDGSILTNDNNVSRTEFHLDTRNCDVNGKVTCELTDHALHQTYSMETYIFKAGCPPKFCHEEVHWRHVEATLFNNVTVSFCFMIDDTGLNVSQRTVFKNAESIALNDTMKYTSDIIASNETEVKKQFTFTIVDVEENDFGHYSMNLQTGDGNSITFTFTLVAVRNPPLHYGGHSHVSISIAVTVILLVIILATAIYILLRKMKFELRCCIKKSDVLMNQNVDRTKEGNSYVKLTEVN